MIVLTGGAGFIGANTLAALDARGRDDVLVVDDVGTSGQWRHLVGRSYLGYLHRDELWAWLAGEGPAGSIPAPAAADPDALDAVIHLGACSDTTEEDFDFLTVNNVRYTRRLWSVCARRGVPFVYASSAATYGDGSLGFSDDHDLVAELEPLNAYGYSKHRFDLWALERAEAAPPAWYGLRFFNVYGPHEDHKGRMASVTHHAIGEARREGRIRLFRSHRPDVEDGEQQRDFVWVGDAVETILNLLDRRPPSGIYNVGTGRARTFADLARGVFEALDRPPSIEYFDMPEELRGRYQYFTEADVGKLEEAGAAPSWTSLEEGIARYVEHLAAASGASGPAGASAQGGSGAG